MIKIYNTLTRRKEEFKPLNNNLVKIYTCGVTVYDDCHIGHGRSLYLFEVIRRYFKFRGYKVKFVRNITDIDDKIINRARQLNISTEELAKKYIDSYYQDIKDLGIDKADIEPKATDNIPKMVEHIQGLIAKRYAYLSEGDVYFRVRSFKEYGKLSGQNSKAMLNSVRIEPNEKKEDPLDFALWKKSKEFEPKWPSPWSEGRPGWHIECSVMSLKYLETQTLDIHGGGRDLIFPHHENEIAQSEALTNKPFANYWIHHGLLSVNGQKMSKSLKNFLTLKEAINKYSSDTLKIFYLSSHYRSPLDFNQEKMEESARIKERISIFIQQLRPYKIRENLKSFSFQRLEKTYEKFIEALDDDFNMPLGFSVIFDLVKLVNENLDKGKPFLSEAKTLLYKILEVFVLFGEEKQASSEFINYVEKQVKERESLRKLKKFKEADAIRKKLFEEGIVLEDLKGGNTRWRFK